MGPRFTSDVIEIRSDARNRASKVGCHEYTTLHLGYSLLRNPCGLLRRTISDKSVGDRALSLFKARTAGTGLCNSDCKQVPPSTSVMLVYARFENAVSRVSGGNQPAKLTNKLTRMHTFILGLLEDLEFRKLLEESKVQVQNLKAKLESFEDVRYSIDVLTESGMVNHLPLRYEVIQNVRMNLSSIYKKKHVMLIGEPEVGKTAVIQELGLRIIKKEFTDDLNDMRLVRLDMSGLLKETGFTFQKRLQQFMQSLQKTKNTILIIDDFSTISGKTLSTLLKELQLLMPRQDVACIGVATKGVYTKFLEKDIGGYFQIVEVPELEDTSTKTILRARKHEFEGHHGVRVLDSAIEAAVNLSKKYIKGKHLPGKAISLIDAACGKVGVRRSNPPETIKNLRIKQSQLEEEYYSLSCENVETVEVEKSLKDLREELTLLTKNYKEAEDTKETLGVMLRERAKLMEEISEHGDDVPVYKLYALDKVLVTIETSEDKLATVGPDEIADVVSQWSGLPLSRLAGDEEEELNGLAERLQDRVIGQDKAVDEVARAVKRSRNDLGSSERPYGSFLFLGPTGVGKTELAKAVASELFGDERLITRIDMSEYKDIASVTKLIGAAPGYAGYDEGGRLTNAVKKRPYSVILFDEAEKADKGIFDVLSQVLSDGRLTDNMGCTVDFTSTIIIFTSNVGADCLFESLSREAAELKVLKKVNKHFTSGFLGRLDAQVVFHPLKRVHIRRIVDLIAQDAARRVSELGINLQFDKHALELIAIEGYNEKMGARPLDRYMDCEVVDRLVHHLLYNNLGEKSSVFVSEEGGTLRFAVKRRREGGQDEFVRLPDKKPKQM